MKKAAIISLALLLVVAATAANAQYHRTMATTILEQPDFYKSPEREHIQRDSFRRIDSVKGLPKAVRDYLGEIADPGERWRESPTLSDSQLPYRHLVFAAVSNDHLIVYYEIRDWGQFNGIYFDIFSFKQDFSFDAKSFDAPKYDLFAEADCFGRAYDITPTMIRAKDVIYRGSGRTSKKLETIDELKAAILEAEPFKVRNW